MTTNGTPIRDYRANLRDAAPGHTLSDALVMRGGAERLRIMHVIDRLDLGGTEKVMMKLIDQLDSGIFEHTICTLRGASAAAREWNPGVPLIYAGKARANLQLNILRLARRMWETRPAIVHSRNWGAIEAVAAARIAGVPVIIHSEHGYQLEMQHGLPLRQRIFRKLAYQQATAVFAVTDELRRYHEAQAYCSPGSIGVVPNGVDTDKFHPSNDMRASIRDRKNIPADRLVIGFIGRLVALKNVMTLLQAIERLAPEAPHIHALIVGSGPEREPLETYARRSQNLQDRISFTGAAENVEELLPAMDVFVLPSLMEGMSNTLLEALACGVPVVATQVGGNPEIVEDGVCGYLFKPGDVDDLTCRLRTLARDENRRRGFAEAARVRAVSEFGLHRMVDRYREMYVGLAKERGVAVAKEVYVRN